MYPCLKLEMALHGVERGEFFMFGRELADWNPAAVEDMMGEVQ